MHISGMCILGGRGYNTCMAMRKIPLVNGEYYHIFNRSIAGFKIFNKSYDFIRFVRAMQYYQSPILNLRYSRFSELSAKSQNKILSNRDEVRNIILSYSIMPTHFHFILRQDIDNGINNFIGNLTSSYTRYFNILHKRKGPLWESKFMNVRIESDEQLLHLIRYIHLNPTSAGLVNEPQDWQWSSYNEYLNEEEKICQYKEIINIPAKEYKKFVMDRKDYQKELSKIKSMLIDNYTG